MRHYKQLKSLLQVLNATTGFLFLMAIGLTLPINAVFTGMIILDEEVRRVYISEAAIYYFLFYLLLIVGADIDKKVRSNIFCFIFIMNQKYLLFIST